MPQPYKRTVAVLALALVAGACSDVEPVNTPEPPAPPPQLAGAFMGEVDAVAGTVTFTPLSPQNASPTGNAAFAFYGDQNILVRLSATNVTNALVPGNPSLREWSYDVGIQNLLPHSIGSNQNGPAPSDTLGIFVFFVDGPIVTAPTSCPGCSVQIVNPHGSASFTTVARQPYFYWRERVAPAGSAGDQTVGRPRWRFRGNANITNFRFLVLVNAAWPPNAETRWKVDYRPDSVPNVGSEPDWTTRGFVTNGTGAIVGGKLRITANSFGTWVYLRSDSIGLTQNGYVEAHFTPISASNNEPQALLGFAVPTKLIVVGFGRRRGGFIDEDGTFVTGTTFNYTFPSGGATIQVRKFGNQRVEVWEIRSTPPNVLLANVNYSALPPNPYSPLTHSLFGGSRVGVNGSGQWDWSYVIAEIGATQP